MVHTHGQRFDVNCSILFTELPLLKRSAAARSAGFDAVEFWWPFAEPVPPDHEVDRFVEVNGCEVLIALYGNRADELSEQQQDELTTENLALAAQGYAGWIGCKFKPSDPADSTTSFGWR